MRKAFLIFSILIFIFCMGCNNISTGKASIETTDTNGSNADKITIENNTMKTDVTENITQNNNTKKEKEIKKDEKEVSGLLLGLKKTIKSDATPTEYETLWIFQDDESITIRRGKGFLSVPYGEFFYKIQNMIYEDKEFYPEADDKSDEAPLYNYDHKFHFINTVAYPFGSKPDEIYDDSVSWGDGEWPIRTTKDEVLFAGNKYILINKIYFETGGGTFNASWYENSLYELKYLGKDYKKNTVNLNDFIDFDKAKIENYKKEYNKDLNYDEELKDFIRYEQSVNDKNSLVTRKDGHWIAVLPLEQIYAHQGNGSMHTTTVNFLELTDKVSDELLCHDDLVIPFETIKKQIPEARDAVSSPNGSMLAVFVNDRIDIYLYPGKDDELKKADYSIPISAEQSIVSNKWATNNYVKRWDDTLKKYLTADNIK